ncbi:ArsR/SmtB family transcription factor [Verrucosispora sioxanthis]|uniref:ArsR/SmtB family transcription factor n=1 Tax=Verrucosispora sioxanthis TaxID=2499994 RepID=UPI0028166C13|nr:hypothetical protein [Verrucosispora sioxanthis]
MDALALGDASPGEIANRLDMPTNLIAHHVKVLTQASLVVKVRSEGDRRRTYLQLRPETLAALATPRLTGFDRVVFVCTHNSARSQLGRHSCGGTAPAAPPPRPARNRRPGSTPARRRGPPPPTRPRSHRHRPRRRRRTRRRPRHRRLRQRPRGTDRPATPPVALVGSRPGPGGHRRGVRVRLRRPRRPGRPARARRPTRRPTMTSLARSSRPDLSVDQHLALRTAATRLAAEFHGTYGPETIERFLHSSYDQFAVDGRIPHYLPLLAERFARQRLQALARVEGHHRDGRPSSCFCAPTMRVARRWRSGSSSTWPAIGPWPGPVAASRAPRSIPPRWRP